MKLYAHSLQDTSEDQWQTLDEHSQNTASLAASFAKVFNSDQAAYLLGLLHDLGKARESFQKYLMFSNGIQDAEYDFAEHSHSGTGACWCKEYLPPFGLLFAYCIAGHHAGLADKSDCGAASLDARLQNDAHTLDEPAVKAYISRHEQEWKKYEKTSFPWKDFSPEDCSMWIRMLYSCLVDADFLDTERFIDQTRTESRSAFPEIHILAERFFKQLNYKQKIAPATNVNKIRAEIRDVCENAAMQAHNLFSLTVPTGGGKTLSGMAFAFCHALNFGKKRIIYVIPYTSIIEQTSDVLRAFLGQNAVLEHHSNFSPDKETMQTRLASENWDAPIVITTSVQFFESLYASKSSRCRKLHNIADSVIILDEVQLLPPPLLGPCCAALKQLISHYHSTLLLTTATQPVLPGLESVREIIPKNMDLFRRLKRTDIKFPAPETITRRKTWSEVAEELLQYEQVLCVVNTRKDCKQLFDLMPSGTIHLSASMCGEHRSRTIRLIKQQLEAGEPVRVISTQLVEAGVDIDFPVVYRAFTGLSSIVQTAGRCNREGRMKGYGKVIVFMPENRSPNGELRFAEDTMREKLGVDPDDPDVFPDYFRLYYGKCPDYGSIFAEYLVTKANYGSFQFRTADEKFRMIDDKLFRPLIVRYNETEIAKTIKTLREIGPKRDIMRKLQRYTVNIPVRTMERFLTDGLVEELKEYPGIFIQSKPSLYNDTFGVDMQMELLTPEETII